MSINMNSQLQDTEAQEKSPRSTLISPDFPHRVVCRPVDLLFNDIPPWPELLQAVPNQWQSDLCSCLINNFLVVALLCKRSQKFSRYWLVAYGLFIASTVVLISDLFSGYNTDFVQFFGSTNPNQTLALAKVYDTILVVVPIIFLTLISGANLDHST